LLSELIAPGCSFKNDRDCSVIQCDKTVCNFKQGDLKLMSVRLSCRFLRSIPVKLVIFVSENGAV
jgi:hypothetical protein